MKKATKPSVGKLLRVLVAGGAALAGTAVPLAARAEDAPEKSAKSTTERADTTQQPAATKQAAGKEKSKEKEKETAKKAEEAGGVKGW